MAGGAAGGTAGTRWYYRALGRTDDTMNLGGIKVGAVELERACVEGVPCVAEAAAVACPPPGEGPRGRQDVCWQSLR